MARRTILRCSRGSSPFMQQAQTAALVSPDTFSSDRKREHAWH